MAIAFSVYLPKSFHGPWKKPMKTMIFSRPNRDSRTSKMQRKSAWYRYFSINYQSYHVTKYFWCLTWWFNVKNNYQTWGFCTRMLQKPMKKPHENSFFLITQKPMKILPKTHENSRFENVFFKTHEKSHENSPSEKNPWKRKNPWKNHENKHW